MHNKNMVRLGLLFLVLFFASYFSVNAVAEDQQLKKEFQERKKQLASRLKDFYEHQNKTKRFEENRVSGASAVTKKREIRQEKYDLARKKFVEQRKRIVDNTSLEQLIQTHDPKKVAQRLELQKKYVKKRDELNAYEATLPKVPDEEELGLIPIEKVHSD